MDVLVRRCAGLDVHRDTVVATVRVPGSRRRRHRLQHTQTFATTTAGITALGDRLAEHRVTRAGMESTGLYRKPVYHLLEDQLEVWLINAEHLHNVPGRNTDVADSAWIARMVEHGPGRPGFVPPPPIRALRGLTRHRRTLIEQAHPGGAAAGEDPAGCRDQVDQRRLGAADQLRAGHPGGAAGRPRRPRRAGRAGPRPAARHDPRPARGLGRQVSAPPTTACWSPSCWPTSISSRPPSPSSTPPFTARRHLLPRC
jgi:transposase